MNSKKNKKIIFIIMLFTIHYSLFTIHCFAEEQTIITSDTLEYSKGTFTYNAKGNVKIQKADAVIEADEVIYNEQTSEVTATGTVKYNDTSSSIKADRVELNLDTKTGILHDAEILFKKDNYHISGKEIEKKGEKYYSSAEATFTTCDGPEPAWCFKGKNIDAVIGERLKAKNVSFRIKDIPVLYAPYFRVPIMTERKTGFLTPVIGYSKILGAHLNIPFFWAISENRDATISLDMYTKRGIGEGLEYRYIEPSGMKGEWHFYHIRDAELHENFYEIRASHEQRSADGIGGFLNLNYVNEKNFYREFNPKFEIRMNRFLESTGEIAVPYTNSRVYLLSQYWVDLKESSSSTAQRLPEAGYVLYPSRIGQFWFSTTATLSNFWRDEGAYGQRLDVFPRLSYKVGSDVVVLQTLGFRETAYSLRGWEDDAPHREAIEYSINTHTRFLKKYEHFTHVLEPSLGYTVVSDSEGLPVFDSAELFKKTSEIELSLLNRLINNSGEFMVLRASQGFDSEKGDKPFLPFRLEVGIRMPLSLRMDASYDVNTGRLENINSGISAKLWETTISAGQSYDRQNGINVYTAGIALHPYKTLFTEARLWYDAKEKEAKEISVIMRYMSQCWGVNIQVIKMPGDFAVTFMFELKGLGSRKF